MSNGKPEYRLSKTIRRAHGDGPARILPVEVSRGAGHCDRRQFLSSGVSIGFALALVDGASRLAEARSTPDATMTPRVVFAHRDTVRRLVFSHDGSTLVSCSNDGTTKLWNTADLQLRNVIGKEDERVMHAAVITSDDRTLITGGEDGRIRFWDMETGKQLKVLSQRGGAIHWLALSGSGRVLASVSSEGILALRRMPGAELEHLISANKGPLYRVDLTNSGRTAVVAGRDTTLAFWSVANAALLEKTDDPNLWVRAVAYSPDNRYVAAGGTGKVVTVRGPLDLAELRHLPTSSAIRDLAFSRDGSLLAAAVQDGTVKIWQHPSGQPCHDLEGPAACMSVAISPDGRIVAAGDVNGVIALWDLVANRLRGFLFDAEASAVDAVTYQWVEGVTRRKIVTSLPVGTALPIGAECICNTVPGRLEAMAADPSLQRSRSSSRSEELEAKKAAIQSANAKRRMRKLAYQQAVAHQQALMRQAAMMRYQYYLWKRFGPRSHSGGSYSSCTCNKVCTCNTVPY